jgi:4-diphosphocytidyl-2-C-methyl-D-erythritol kinase
MPRLQTLAPAKVNLTLAVLARRADGYHDLSSIVAFADFGDALTLSPGDALELEVEGPLRAAAGSREQNLVLKAARAAGERIEGLRLGRFNLAKNLPAGAGLGGGSSDAAAALRLIAELNDLAPDDARIIDAARATGADVTACLDPRARLMHGIGDEVSAPLDLPPLNAVLVFPGIALATASVFDHFTLAAGPRRRERHTQSEVPKNLDALIAFLAREGNDLELAARLTAPEIGGAKDMLGETDPRLVRMTGSGSAFFALYDTEKLAQRAAAKIAKRRQGWWVIATSLR